MVPPFKCCSCQCNVHGEHPVFIGMVEPNGPYCMECSLDLAEAIDALGSDDRITTLEELKAEIGA